MKIAIIRHSIRNRGGDRLILDHCAHLIGNGHEVVYWTNDVDTHFRIDPRIQIKRIPYPKVHGTIRFVSTTTFDADIVLVDLAVMSIFASILNARKVVYLAQDDDRTYYPSMILRFLMRVVYWVALSVLRVPTIAVSDFLKEKLDRLSRGRVTSVPNGLDHRIFYHDKNSPYAVEKKALMTIVLYARRDFRKGLDIGIKAVEELARLRGVNDWELWTIGDDAVGINVDRLNIKRWGLLKADDLRGVLSVADIYLSPSRHEGFGLMPLEAMACGNVMVTTTAFSLVEDGLNGLVRPVDDWQGLAVAMDRVMNDKDLFRKLQSNGYSLAGKFRLEKSCEAFEGALRSIVSSGSRDK